MPADKLALLALVTACGCSTIRVQYPGGVPAPKQVTIQFYPGKSHNRRSGRDVFDYGPSLALDAGCLKAAFAAGVRVISWRVATGSETEETVTYDFGAIDPLRIARLTGADTIITGNAELNPQSRQVAALQVQARSGASGAVEASAELKNDDGADPPGGRRANLRRAVSRVEAMRLGAGIAGSLLLGGCGSLQIIQAPGPRDTVSSVCIIARPKEGSLSARFLDGCISGVSDVGVKVVEYQTRTPGPGATIFERLSAATGTQTFLAYSYATLINEEASVSTAQVWLMDNHGHVLTSALYRGEGSSRAANSAARELCRAVLTGVR